MSAVVNLQDVEKLATEIPRVFELQQKKKLELRFSTAEQRIEKLVKLREMVLDNKERIFQAAYNDYKKPELEAAMAEVMPVVAAVNFAIKNIKRWMKPQKVKTPINMFGIRSEIRPEAKGVSLIISPWNYPFFLTLSPMASAFAAGCPVMLKPSEMIPQMSGLIAELLRENFAESEVAVFEGDATVATALLDLPFDHIFYTGAPEIGKVVMAAAAKHLTSVTLELGGKSPVIIDESADIRSAAERIAWGKFTNCGQTCVAPDYIFVHESKKKELIDNFKSIIHKAYEGSGAVSASKDFGRIVNNRHHGRVNGLLEDAKQRGAVVEIGGESDSEHNYLAPTMLSNVAPDSEILKSEIFGPLLPIMTFTDIAEAMDFVNNREKPLALYVFSKIQKNITRVLTGTSSGGVSVNNVMLHAMNPYLPFGGVNYSGIGKTNGHFGFREFSNEKAVAYQKSRFSINKFISPPYTNSMKKTMDFVTRHFA